MASVNILTTTAAIAIHPGVMDSRPHLLAYPFGPGRSAEEGSMDVGPRRMTFKIYRIGHE
jgi:hypothetical protein